MEITIEHLSVHLDPNFIKTDVHGRWSLLGHDIDLIRASTGAELIHTVLLVVGVGPQ